MRRICAWLFVVLSGLIATSPVQAANGQAWVEMAPGGGSVVRVLTTADACPVVHIDGRATAMTERAAPATLPVRGNKAQVATPAAFPKYSAV